MVVFLPFPHYRGGYYLKSVAYGTSQQSTSLRSHNVHRFRNSITATSLYRLWPSLICRVARSGLSCAFSYWSEYFCRLRKWESPYPHSSISVAIYHTCRIDANMHKSQVCTIPINSIMGIDEAEPLKNQCFQGFSVSLVKNIHNKLIQNVKHVRKASKRFNTESLSARSVQRASDSKVNRCREAGIVYDSRIVYNFTSCQVQKLYTIP